MTIQGQPIEVKGNVWHIHINKPVYDTCVSLNGEIINQAKANKVKLEVSCYHRNTYHVETIDPDDWVKKAFRYEKVYRYKDRPMVFYQTSIGQKPIIKEEDKPKQLRLI